MSTSQNNPSEFSCQSCAFYQQHVQVLAEPNDRGLVAHTASHYCSATDSVLDKSAIEKVRFKQESGMCEEAEAVRDRQAQRGFSHIDRFLE